MSDQLRADRLDQSAICNRRNHSVRIFDDQTAVRNCTGRADDAGSEYAARFRRAYEFIALRLAANCADQLRSETEFAQRSGNIEGNAADGARNESRPVFRARERAIRPPEVIPKKRADA